MTENPDNPKDQSYTKITSDAELSGYRAGERKPPGRMEGKTRVVKYTFESKNYNTKGTPDGFTHADPMSVNSAASPEEKAKILAAQESVKRAFAKLSRAANIKFIEVPADQADQADVRVFTLELTKEEKEALIKKDETLTEAEQQELIKNGGEFYKGFSETGFPQKDIFISKSVLSNAALRDETIDHELGHVLCLDDIGGLTKWHSIMARDGDVTLGYRPADYLSFQEVLGMSDELKGPAAPVTIEDLKNNRPLYSADGKLNLKLEGRDYDSFTIDPSANGWDHISGNFKGERVGGTLFPDTQIGDIDASSGNIGITFTTVDRPFDASRPTKISAGNNVDRIAMAGDGNNEIRGGGSNDTFELKSGTHHRIMDFMPGDKSASRAQEHDSLMFPRGTKRITVQPTDQGVAVSATTETGQVASVELRNDRKGAKALSAGEIKDMIATENAYLNAEVTLNTPRNGLPPVQATGKPINPANKRR